MAVAPLLPAYPFALLNDDKHYKHVHRERERERECLTVRVVQSPGYSKSLYALYLAFFPPLSVYM